MRRPPAVSGQFYYAEAARLKKQVEGVIISGVAKEKAIGIVSPHAGLIYSGPVAGEVYSSIVFPKTFILIGPNHTGLGERAALWPDGEWDTPIGSFRVDSKLASRIARDIPLIARDTKAHAFEHSLEVQLPFIGHFSPEAAIVPIAVMGLSLSEMKAIGEGLASAVKSAKYDVVIAASSDMSHYISDTEARQKDRLAIDKIIALDPGGLYEVVKSKNISMCGVLPAVIMLYAALTLGAKEARLVKYATSGEVSRDFEHVVGYAGIIVK